ncbi:MAG: AAA family ATPase [Syntrophobacteraceae bacterium]
MYLDFFKFKKSPFNITPDPDFLFLSPSHKEASASIFYGIQTRKGFIAVTGEVGVGKTTILRSYLEATDSEKIKIVYIFNAAIPFNRLLRQICSELGMQPGLEGPSELVEMLFHFLIEEYKNDRNVVLIIDEAQNIPVATLERLRMLSNLETSQDKLMQIILVGQPEFDDKLELPQLRQLKQRIAIHSHIHTLTAEESLAYINHRLMRGSLFHNPVFTPKALKLIVKSAHGIPRTINVLCDNALVTAFGYQRKPVDHKIVKEVIKDFHAGKPRSGLRWKFFALSTAIAALAMTLYFSRSPKSNIVHSPAKDQSFSAELAPSSPGAANTARAKVLPSSRNMPEANSLPAISRTNLSANNPGQEKKTPPVAEKPKDPMDTKAKTVASNRDANISTVSPPKDKAVSPASGPKASIAEPSVSKSVSAVPTGPAAIGVQAHLPKTKEPLPAQPSLVAQPKAETLPPETIQKGQLASSMVVKKGDSVNKLLLDIYGKVNESTLASFKNLNPQIKNLNKIEAGKKIFLPPVAP